MSAQLMATGRHRSGTSLLRQGSVGISEVFNMGPTVIAGVGAVDPLVLPSASRPNRAGNTVRRGLVRPRMRRWVNIIAHRNRQYGNQPIADRRMIAQFEATCKR